MSGPPHEGSETPPVKRKRKSRWGSEDDKVKLPVPPIVVPNEITPEDPNTPSLSGTYTYFESMIYTSIIDFLDI